MIAVYIGVGVLLGAAGMFFVFAEGERRKCHEEFERARHEELDSFSRCQAYLDAGGGGK